MCFRHMASKANAWHQGRSYNDYRDEERIIAEPDRGMRHLRRTPWRHRRPAMTTHDTQATEEFWQEVDDDLYNNPETSHTEGLKEDETHADSGNEPVRPTQDTASDRDN